MLMTRHTQYTDCTYIGLQEHFGANGLGVVDGFASARKESFGGDQGTLHGV
jgi:hypothetical protein